MAADAARISPDILDKTPYLDLGEWMFVSFRATELRNIPVFIKAPNKEEVPLTRSRSLLLVQVQSTSHVTTCWFSVRVRPRLSYASGSESCVGNFQVMSRNSA